MNYKIDNEYAAIRLEPDEKLMESIKIICEKEKITGGFIASCVASINHVVIRNVSSFKEFPITDKNRTFREFSGTFELISANGNISTIDNDIIVHIHAALSDKTATIFGGHLVEASILSTAEILIIRTSRIARNKDDITKTYELLFR